MTENQINNKTFKQIEEDLNCIKNKIENENLDLDTSLDLYEKALKLGMEASDNIEKNIMESFNTNNVEIEKGMDE